MSEIPNDSLAREQVSRDVQRLLATLHGKVEVSDVDLMHYRGIRDSTRDDENYSDGRSKADVAVKLGVSTTQLSKALRGQRILDIGGGRGVFAGDVAKDKSTHVTVLENDPEMLLHVPERPNITAVEGDGYDLLGSGLEPASYDSVFVTYSTNFWADSPAEAARSVLEPLRVLKPNGAVYYTPIAQNLGIADAGLSGLLPDRFAVTKEHDINRYYKVRGAFALQAYALLQTMERYGGVEVAYRESHKNARFKKKQLADGRLISPDSYSAILTAQNPDEVLAKLQG